MVTVEQVTHVSQIDKLIKHIGIYLQREHHKIKRNHNNCTIMISIINTWYIRLVLSLHCAIKILKSKLDKCPNSCFLSFQLGFGSFLGIIGAHLIENKRQMVRGFILPLCTEISFSASCHLISTSLILNWILVPVTLQQTKQFDHGSCSPTHPEELHVLSIRQTILNFGVGVTQPEIEIGCKWRKTDVRAGMWGRKLQMSGAGGRSRAGSVRAAVKNVFVSWHFFPSCNSI